MANANKTIVFGIKGSKYFAKLIAEKLNIPLGEIESTRFGSPVNGEVHLRLAVDDFSALSGKDVIIVGSTHTDDALNDLYRIGCTASDNGVRRLIFVIPFFGYSTMETASLAGESIAAKHIIRQLSAIPQADVPNTFLFTDLHSDEVLSFFEGNVKRFELYSGDALVDAVKDLNLKNFMLGSADMGRTDWVKFFAHTFGTDIAYVDKDRKFKTTKVFRVEGDVKGKNVIVYDDMARGGGTLFDAADAYYAHGAKEVYAVLSHGAFNTPKVIKTANKSVITKIVITNTHPMSKHKLVRNSDKFVVVDVSSIFADKIEKILQ